MSQQFEYNRQGKSGEWKCVVMNEPWNMNVKVYLINEAQRKVATLSQDGHVVMTEAVEGVSQPFMTLPYNAWQSIISAMGEVEPDVKREATDSELKATKYHLQDMRKLLKLV